MPVRGPTKPKQCPVLVLHQGKRPIKCGIYLDADGFCPIHGKQV